VSTLEFVRQVTCKGYYETAAKMNRAGQPYAFSVRKKEEEKKSYLN
jgi:hypothetical protein